MDEYIPPTFEEKMKTELSGINEMLFDIKKILGDILSEEEGHNQQLEQLNIKKNVNRIEKIESSFKEIIESIESVNSNINSVKTEITHTSRAFEKSLDLKLESIDSTIIREMHGFGNQISFSSVLIFILVVLEIINIIHHW